MEHVLSLSYGKDSLACLGAIEELGWPLDRIIHAEVWATDTIPADLPPMVEFKVKADAIIRERWGIQVEHIRAKKTYEQQFYTTYKKGSRPGAIYGWPILRGPWCNSMLKVGILDKNKGDRISYFDAHGHTVHDFERRFRLEDDGLISPDDKVFRWSMLEEPLNFRMF